jgi:hypothetical protein
MIECGILMLFGFLVLYIFFSSNKPHISQEDYSNPVLINLREKFRKLDPSYANIPMVLSHNGAYTEGKSYIAMCIRDPKSGEMYDENVVMYVALHELAHYLSKSYGHGPEFIMNFSRLLERARRMGLYRDIIPPDDNFCGA